ncbi:MAG TPA: hypothetical protein VE007_07240 [Thermoanaerobaculia bacterium]|nr:hypothetical protein [Thermoanaerobaculia bacterium]
MFAVEDFTRLPVGTDTPVEGRVDRCPKCGRNGVPVSGNDGAASYLHVQTSEVIGDGMFTEPKDCCRL